MPFTPFHLGPGALFKAVGNQCFSFMIFGGSQVIMDIEPLMRMIRADSVVHGMSHTVAGAFVVAMISAVLGRPLSNAVLRHSRISDHPIGWMVAFASAFIGTYSHIGLDAMMHSDMSPIWPMSSGNSLLGFMSVERLHVLCAVSGLLGGGFVALRTLRHA